MHSWWKRLVGFFFRSRLDRELSEEIEAHLAMQEAEFRQAGLSPQEARDAARREFGGVARTQEAYREKRGLPWIETAGKDLRYALRGLRRSPGFTSAAVLSLAFGIGANTAVFSMFRALLLRMLPVSKPEELVTLYRTGAWGAGYSSYPLYLEVQKRADLLQGVIARSSVEKVRFSAGSGDRMEMAQREYVSGNYFDILGVGPAIGRLFKDEDNRMPHAHPLAILSYDFWQSRFGADPNVIGRRLVVDEQPLTVIGVAARGFRGVEVDRHPDLWVPAMMTRGEILEPGMHWLYILARRRPEVTRGRVQAAMDVLLKQYLVHVYGGYPNVAFRKIAMAQQIEAREGGVGLSLLRDQFGQPLAVLMAAVGLVLLAACANVAHLLLARAAARRQEIALRVSLGATRTRLIGQALMESLLLAAGGAAVGILLAFWLSRGILRFLPASAGEPFRAEPDAAMLVFTLGISLAAAILFGLVPAFRSTAVDPAASLQGGARQTSGPQSRLRRALVAAQVAFSVVLVVLAGLFGHSLAELRSVNLGFRNQNVIAFTLDFPNSWSAADIKASRERLLARMETLPGVTLVSYGFPGPFMGGYSNSTIRIPGSETSAQAQSWVSVQKVGPRFFEAIGSAVVEGREINRSDTMQSRKVAVVNREFVRQYLPGDRHVLDRALEVGRGKSGATVYIVGVVPDIPHRGLRKKAEPTVYLASAQGENDWEPTILVRSQLPPESRDSVIRREATNLGPQIVTSEPRTIRQQINDSIFRERLLATLGGVFGGLALLLAAVGLYGVVAYGTACRIREIGIRIALGARRGEVLWMILRDALLLVGVGLAVGLPFSLLAAKHVGSVLFGIQPADSVTFVITVAVLAVIGAGAALLPARRAAGLEPMRVLRNE
jgi:predicted permease